MRLCIVVIAVAACKLGPLVSDETLDAAPAPDAAAPGSDHILPPGTAVPSISTNAELINQIRINDGLNDTTLMNNGGVVIRGTGKSAGAVVRFWNFGPALIESNIAVVAPLYVFGTVDGAGVFTPLPDHPPLIDTICGDVRYSAMRRVINVALTDHYAGERITSLAALSDAIELGLAGDPVPDGTWVNMPVVLPDTKLEVGTLSSRHRRARNKSMDVAISSTCSSWARASVVNRCALARFRSAKHRDFRRASRPEHRRYYRQRSIPNRCSSMQSRRHRPPECSAIPRSRRTSSSGSRPASPRALMTRSTGGCSPCHLGRVTSGLDLSSYESMRRGGLYSGTRVIVVGEPCTSVLWQKLSRTPPFGSRMPLNGPPYFSADELELVHDWIAEGTANN